MTQYPPTNYGQPGMQGGMQGGMGGGYMRPHRGVMILVFGILGLVVCVIFGIVAWVMGSNDLREMQAGTMDRSGEGLTRAGQICGMISVALLALGLVIWVAIMVMAIGAGAAGAAGSGGP